MRLSILMSIVCLSLSTVSLAAEADGQAAARPATAEASTCEHGVKKSVCTRCNPKLEAVFKAKGDWCGEHGRPESQCALCHPDLAKKGVK